ncbi:MAG TPA: ATP-binding protein [Myxococcota bacterium]|nr:ATP-binding protein [Myxococcota bacterium]
MRFSNAFRAGGRISPLAAVSLLVSCVTAAVTLYAWSSLVRGQRVHLRASADAIARECANSLERRAWNQAMALRDLADGWARFEPASEQEWRHDVSALLAQQPSIRELGWKNAGAQREVRVDAQGIRPDFAEQLAAAEAQVAAGAPHAFVSPVRFESGDWGFVEFIGSSVSAPGATAPRPVLSAAFDFQSFASRSFDDRGSGYTYTLWSGDLPVARATEPAADGVEWWHASEEVTHPFGATWRVDLRPTVAVAKRELSILPHVLLVTGLLAAVMIGALVFSARVASRRARAILATNVALAEIADRAQPQARPRAEAAGGMETVVQERAEELREAVLDLEAFNVSVSHDLRSPIGAIVNLVSVLRETQPGLDHSALDLVRRIESSAQRALARMDGLLDFSRLGRRPLRRETVDLHRMAWRIGQEIRQTESGSRVEFVLNPVPNAHGDAAMIEALLRNLLGNAAKFSRGQEKPRVEFGSMPVAEGEATVYFVRDNGVGFNPRFAEKVFGLFERQHHASEFEGAGVGLAIVSRIARRHAGRVWAESELGEGATFYFTLERPDGDG